MANSNNEDQVFEDLVISRKKFETDNIHNDELFLQILKDIEFVNFSGLQTSTKLAISFIKRFAIAGLCVFGNEDFKSYRQAYCQYLEKELDGGYDSARNEKSYETSFEFLSFYDARFDKEIISTIIALAHLERKADTSCQDLMKIFY